MFWNDAKSIVTWTNIVVLGTGMAGFGDAITSVIDRTSGGKIMVYPQLHDLGLVRLVDLADTLPHVAAKLRGGLWTHDAEVVLLGGNPDIQEKS